MALPVRWCALVRVGIIMVAVSCSSLDNNAASLAMGDEGGRGVDDSRHERDPGNRDRAGQSITESVTLEADGTLHGTAARTEVARDEVVLAEFRKLETRITRQQQRLQDDQVRDGGRHRSRRRGLRGSGKGACAWISPYSELDPTLTPTLALGRL